LRDHQSERIPYLEVFFACEATDDVSFETRDFRCAIPRNTLELGGLDEGRSAVLPTTKFARSLCFGRHTLRRAEVPSHCTTWHKGPDRNGDARAWNNVDRGVGAAHIRGMGD
jgi:hypothetical protein